MGGVMPVALNGGNEEAVAAFLAGRIPFGGIARVNARVLDMATIKPLDEAAVIKAANETGAIMTVEDHTIYGGLGSAVAEVVVKNAPVPMELIGIQDRFGESGDPELIYKDHGMDVDSIVAKAKLLVARKRG